MAKILVIDDESAILEMTVAVLCHSGHEAIGATNGDDALKLVRESHFDLVITDIVMPGKEGLEIIATLRRQAPKTRIIAMSGGGIIGRNDYLKLAFKFGASQTLAKPF